MRLLRGPPELVTSEPVLSMVSITRQRQPCRLAIFADGRVGSLGHGPWRFAKDILLHDGP